MDVASGFRLPNAVRSVSAAGSATSADDIILLSGASFTLDLYSAVGNTGRTLTLIHNGTSLTQVYTLDGSGLETIGGSATYGLYTAGEMLKIISDGSNWKVLEHFAATNWISYIPTITGFGTATSVEFFWKRIGTEMLIRGSFISGTVTADLAKISLPSGATIDTTSAGTPVKYSFGNFTYAATTVSSIPTTTRGPWKLIYVSGTTDALHIADRVDTDFGGASVNSVIYGQQPGNGLLGNTQSATVDTAFVPISGWNP